MNGDDRVRTNDQPEWVREVIGGLRREITDLRSEHARYVDMAIRQAKWAEMMTHCAETMARYGTSLDRLGMKMNELEKALLGNKIKFLWSASGALGGALIALGVWVVTHSGIGLAP